MASRPWACRTVVRRSLRRVLLQLQTSTEFLQPQGPVPLLMQPVQVPGEAVFPRGAAATVVVDVVVEQDRDRVPHRAASPPWGALWAPSATYSSAGEHRVEVAARQASTPAE